MSVKNRPGFTIIELLVVVSIIALLVGILLPAISKARDQAKFTTSVANLRNLGTAHAAYASGYGDRQVTFVVDEIASYGTNACTAFREYNDRYGPVHTNLILGWGPDKTSGEPKLWQYFLDGTGGHHCWAGNPIDMGNSSPGFGHFRFGHQTRAFSPYLNGRYYDPVFWAAKDKFLYEVVKYGFDSPAQFASIPNDDGTEGQVLYVSSYCLSPAAMYAPSAFAYDEEEEMTYSEPWDMGGGLKCPSPSQALYPHLKTRMLEHHWLQNSKLDCNPGFDSAGTFQGCETFYFNHGWDSEPATLFFDGHVEVLGVKEAMKADSQHKAQVGYGLWMRDTPLGADGYFIDYSYDMAETSYHILTTNGIRGRDKSSK